MVLAVTLTAGTARVGTAGPAPAAVDLIRAEVEAERQLRAELGTGFKLRRTDHFRIAYDTGEEFAEFHGGLFEAVYAAFHDFFAHSGFRISAPARRLEAVLFDTREEFRRYAVSRDPQLGESGGFYGSAENRIAFFDSFQDPQYRRLRERIGITEAQMRDTRSRLAQIESDTVTITHADGRRRTVSHARASRILDRKERRVARDRRELNSYFRDRNLTTTIHECVHQLAFNSGVQRIGADNPKWLGEGIATYFETVGYRDVGPTGSRNPERTAAYRQAQASGSLIPLAELLAGDHLFSTTTAAAATAYGQAWALVSYLLAERPAAFFGYLRGVAVPGAGDPAPGTARVAAFRAAFGDDLAAVEGAVAAYVASLG